MPDDNYQPPPMPEEITATPVRGFHMFMPKGPGVVLRVVGMDGSQNFFVVDQLEYFARVVEVWNTDLKAALAARQIADPVTWQQLTMELAMMLLPLDQAERHAKILQLGRTYATALEAAGHTEAVINVNLGNMLARVAECLAKLEVGGGKIGTA